jgi:hypothetical protein
MPVSFDNKGFIRVKAQIKSGLLPALVRGAEDVKETATQLAPVGDGRGGHLNTTGKVIVVNNHTVNITFGEGLPDERAIAQEYGTVFMSAQPYLTPALNEVDVLHYVREELGFT